MVTREDEHYLESARETLDFLRHRLSDKERQRGLSDGRYRIEVDSVKLEDRDDGKAIVVMFRAEERPGCLFGFEMDAVEPLEEDNPDDDRRVFSDPREWGAVVLTNLDETLSAINLGLPEDCARQAVNWV
ncbi:hypothetical protein GBA63_09370 [Rubrobacter tropicus]|uniref:Uncharacterized protein n=1 Tax=Rubrobacter tropicus TaxID=2653851 RepID=A0A6G8Q8N5_9ACTN|nr:hypothetical protein [Rubrobacter tropicus]QIN82836.1 hypothetical protein GBA63_09370 [Rubrobacter tropicus]